MHRERFSDDAACSRTAAVMRSELAPSMSTDRGKRKKPNVEEVEIRTQDGWSLRADIREPAGAPAGIAVLAHAFMARRTEFDRPAGGGLSAFLASRGWRVVTFDFRAHGDSGPRPRAGGAYGYDDLVTHDLPAVCSFARSRAKAKMPLVVVGHSLGGHVALVAQATGAIQADAVVGIAASPWVRELEPLRSRWMVKRAFLEAAVLMARRFGRLPARAIGRGSDDEPLRCVNDFSRFARKGWTSADGRTDYLACLGRVRVPVMGVVSQGDRLECPPACGERLLARTKGRQRFVRIAQRDDGSSAPGHMGIVTSGRVKIAWAEIEGFMRKPR
jgi:predicted alpha/beta hydrolase